VTHRHEREDGFTLIELIVTTLLVGIVTLVLFATSDSMAKISATTQSRSQSLGDARTALERIERDLRAANPVDAISGATSQYDNKISFSVYCKTGSAGCVSNLRPVSYAVANGVLTQSTPSGSSNLLQPIGTPSLPVAARRGAVVNAATDPVFTYYRRDGTPISTLSSGPPASYFRDCTKAIKVHLIVRAEPRSTRVIDLVTTVNLRNYNEVNPC
jgi:prepilin-type N-terminal cleavage/methylation domain-containing protein